MHPRLEEIDKEFSKIQKYIRLDRHAVERLDDDQLLIFLEERERAEQKYRETYRTLTEIVGTFSKDEIITGFQESCELLQACLGGIMLDEFVAEYIPTMIAAINRDHEGSYLFLQKLSQALPNHDLIPVIKSALGSSDRKAIEMALGIIQDKRFKQLVPQLKDLIRDNVIYAQQAEIILNGLEQTD